MVGNARSGRKAPQIDKRQRLDPTDIPERPNDLDAIGAAYWASSIAPTEHLRRLDSDMAGECCRQYSLYRRAVVACESIPLDDEAAKTCGKYYDRWLAIVKLLGLDYFARMKSGDAVRRDRPGEEVSTEEKFFGVVG